jgi:hypothetical protein
MPAGGGGARLHWRIVVEGLALPAEALSKAEGGFSTRRSEHKAHGS